MSRIKILERTEDSSAQEICRQYWETDEDGSFVHKVSAMAERLGIKQHEVIKYVKEHSKAYPADAVCEKCGEPLAFIKSRSDFAAFTRQNNERKFCPDCQELVNEREAELRREQASKARENITKQMQSAFENGIYEALDTLEFKFLIALATCDDTRAAAKKVGLSDDNADKLFKRFNDLHLVSWDNGIYKFIPEFGEALKRYKLRHLVQPIFNPQTLKLYQKLKQEFLFVFPEVPIAAFIQKADIEDLLTEDWHADYFLRARVDFLICNQEGMPQSAVEYHGGYHQSSEHQAKLDKFKEMLLRKAGIALRQITHQELAEL